MSHDEELERAMHKIGALRYELELLQSENKLVREESDRHYQLWVDSQAEVERLTAEVSYDKRVQLHVDKLAAEFTQYEVENLKAEVERFKFTLEEERQITRQDWAGLRCEHDRVKRALEQAEAEVERLTKENETINKDRALLWESHKIALQDIQGLHYALQAAKEGKPQS